MDALMQDLRYATRSLSQKPGFTIVVAICLALGVGANTAIFSIVNAVMLRPLAFPDAELLVGMDSECRPTNFPIVMQGVSYPNFAEWKTQNDAFADMGVYHPSELTLSGVGDPERLQAAVVTADFFTTLQTRAAIGRLFTPEDEREEQGLVAVLSHGYWQRRFGGDSEVVGRTVTLDQESRTIVGVLPAGFQFPHDIPDAQVWIPVPVTSSWYASRGACHFAAVGRLKAGVTLEQARTRMNTVAARLEETHPNVNTGYSITLAGLSEKVVGDTGRPLALLLGAVGLVLLIACGNVANLFLARGTGRRRELAVRAALGAGRRRLARMLLTESMLLGLLGGGLGLLLAVWGSELLIAVLPGDIPRVDEIGLDWRVLAFALTTALVTGLLFGLPSALSVSRIDVHTALKEDGRTSGAAAPRQRLQNFLVTAETALATALLIGAGLLIRSFGNVTAVDPGFATENVLTFQMDVNATTPCDKRADLFDEITTRLAGLPGVTAVSLGNGLPLTDKGLRTSAQVLEGPNSKAGAIPFAGLRAVSPSYFATMGMHLMRGRLFDDVEARGRQGVMVIDEEMVRRYWPNEDPLGKRIRPGSSVGRGPDYYEIIGVVGNVRDDGLDIEQKPNMYVPYRQHPSGLALLALRTNGEPLRLVDEIRAVLAEITPHDAPFAFSTMDQYLADSVADRRYPTLLLSAFAVLAVLLAGLGIYGVLAYAVTQRTHELGVRMALGARRSQILSLVLGRGMRLTLIGVCAGLVTAYAGTRLLEAWLFGVTAFDTPTFAAAAAIFILIALAACYIPARRATAVDPMKALRCE